mgnify:CR=1 FL=1
MIKSTIGQFANSLGLNKDEYIPKEGASFSLFKIKTYLSLIFYKFVNKNTYFLWLLPLFLFFIGGAIIFKLFIIKKN